MLRRNFAEDVFGLIASKYATRHAVDEFPWPQMSGYSSDKPLIIQDRTFGPGDAEELERIFRTPHILVERCLFKGVSLNLRQSQGSTAILRHNAWVGPESDYENYAAFKTAFFGKT